MGDGGDGDRANVDDALVGDGALDDGAHPAGKLAGVTGRIVEEDGTLVVAMRVELLEVDLRAS